MTHTDASARANPGDPKGTPFGDIVRNCVRYWEFGRIGYNLVLSGVALGWIALTWPHFRPALTLQSALVMAVLAAGANACYCAAYPVDIAIQCVAPRGTWKRRRWMLWYAGALLAVILECYWIADEIYPAVA